MEAVVMQNKKQLTTQQAVAHLAIYSNQGRGSKAEPPIKQRPFHILLKQQLCPQLCSAAILGYN